MSLSSIGNAMSSMIADSETSKAKLLLYYPSEEEVTITETKSGAITGFSSKNFNPLDGMNFNNEFSSITKNVTSSFLDQAKNSFTKNTKTTFSNVLEVPFQFNPSHISISAYGGGMRQILDFGAGEKQSDAKVVDGDANGNNNKTSGIKYMPMDPNICVSFSTIFDATKNSDAFVSDKINLNLTNVTKNITDLIQGNSYSVRPVVEGLLEAVRDHDKRNARFVWGDMDYQGLLNSIQARYTMFNTKGEPIRAQVNFSMMVPLESPINTASEFWKDRYNEIVDKNSGGYITVASSSASSIANSLLNLQN